MSNSIPAQMLDKFTTFGDLLRFLRRRAGVTQLELSIQVGYSDAQISRLEQNLRMPDIPTIEARFVSALDLQDEPQAVSRLLDLAANVRREDAPGLGLCPYKGLNYFDEADADLFVGRESLTGKLTDRLLSFASASVAGQERFLAIVGASGSGKSSLVRAGLVPALRWNKTSVNWLIYVLNPTAHPLESLAACLIQENGSVARTAELMDDLKQEPRSLSLYIKRLVRSAGSDHLVLVVDQFEELFTLCHSEEQRLSFINNLLIAASEEDGPAIIVITLRADFYAYCAGYPQLRKALAQQQEYIGTMSDEELRRAIEEPARRGRWEFEPGLVDLLLHDVGHEPGALPLLSHALLETWGRRRGRMLTLSGYTSSGGVRGAIAETAQAVFVDQFTQEQQAIARRIFLRLTELGDETATGDTRRRASFEELILKPEEEAATQAVLKALADARLITTSQDSVEVAHEALIREWPTLRGWLEDNREGLRLHRHLTETAQEWLSAGRDPDLLYRGARLVQAREWALSQAGEFNTQENDFLAESIAYSEREAAERELQRQRQLETALKLAEAEKQQAEVQAQRAEEQALTARQLRKRAFFLAGALVIALGMAFIALSLGARARQAAAAAQNQQRVAFSRELAAASVSNLEIDPERSILLAMQAISVTYAIDKTWTAEAEDALHRALTVSRVQLTLRGHADRVWAVAFNPDGTRLATVSDDGTAKIWDASSGQELFSLSTEATRGHHGLAFSPDGTRLATAGGVGTAKVWDIATGKVLLTLQGHTDWVSSVTFSPDGTRLATAGEDGTAKVWDAATGQELLTLQGHTLEVWDVAFNSDGSRLATSGEDGKVKVWDAVSGKELFTLAGHAGPVYSVAFTPAGNRLASASGDRYVKIWDAASGQELLTLRGHSGGIWAVAFSPDGKRLATTSFDGDIKIWDASNGQELLTLKGHTGLVVGAAFSPDCNTLEVQVEQCGTRLATASWDGTVRMWNVSFSQELLTLFTPNATTGAFSLDGMRLATGYADGSVKVWDLSGPLQAAMKVNKEGAPPNDDILNLQGHLGTVSDVAFSSNGQRLATTGEDQVVKVWNLANGSELFSLQGNFGEVDSIVFNPDGTRLATAGNDYTVRVWDVTQKASQELFPVYSYSRVNSVVFSPDGKRLATANQDGTAKVWDAGTGKEILTLQGHSAGVYSLTYSSDGTRLATASDDGKAKVWDSDTGQELLTLLGHFGWVNAVAFSSDGKRLATAGQDKTVKLWDARTGEEQLTLRGYNDAVIGVIFSSDGKYLLTASQDGTIRIFLLQIGDLVALGQKRLTRSITSKECQQYLHLSESQCPQDSTMLVLAPTPASEASNTPGPASGKVCLATDESGVQDQFFNQMAYAGLLATAEKLNWETAVLEPGQPSDYVKNITELINSHCDLIVLPTGQNFSDDVQAVAEANPDLKFQVTDITYETHLDNIWEQVYAVDQAGFLAGYVAASVTKTGKVGTFGGVAIPPVIDFMNGYALGVVYFNEKNETHVEVLGWDVAKGAGLFSGNFDNPNDGRRIAEKLIGEGADIILPVAGRLGLGAASAVKEHGNAYIIGVDSDWVITYPEFSDIILTSIMKRLDVSVISAVQSIVDGSFTGGRHIGTLENGGVSLAPFHSLDGLIPAQVKADLEQIKADIIAGKIKTEQ